MLLNHSECRLELKIDELREMIWELHNESAVTKRHKKQ